MVDDVPVDALRPALELAVDAALAGRAGTPPAVRPFLRGRLDRRSLDGLRRVIEELPEFRAEVAAHASEDNVDQIGLLWLTRPAGWEARLAALLPQRDDRRLRAVEDKLRRREERLADLQSENDRLRQQAANAARASLGLEDEIARLQAELAEARAAQRRADNAARQAAEQAAAARAAKSRADERAIAAERAHNSTLPQSLAEATALAERLHAVLRRSAEALDQRARKPKPAAAPKRVPQMLPGGVLAGTPAAAEHLLRVAGIAVLIDGYNVAMLGWPELPLERQREEGVHLAESIGKRFSVVPTVVFDGAEVAGAHSRGRRTIRVEYSPAGVSADDVIRQRVAALAADVPVLVVTNDREILDDVRARGANTVSSDVFLQIARR